MAMEQYSRLKLEFDQVTGAMKFVGQEAVSLQKQVRLLRQELTLGSYTAEQFSKIQNALAETEFKLKQTQLRGQDLFQMVGSLGGQFGEMSNRIDRALKLFNALNNVTFDELKDKVKNIFALVRGDVESISDEIEKIETGGRPAGMRESVGNVGDRGYNIMQGASTAIGSAAGVAGGAISARRGAAISPQEVIDKVILEKTNAELQKREQILTNLAKANVAYQESQKKNILFAENYIRKIEEQVQLQRKNDEVLRAGSVQEQFAAARKIADQKRLADFEEKYFRATSENKKILLKSFEAESLAIEQVQKKLFGLRAQPQTEKDFETLTLAAKALEKQFKDTSFVVQEGTIMIGYHDLALRKLTDAEIAAIVSGEKLILTQEGIIEVETVQSVVTKKTTAETLGYTVGVKLATAANYLYVNSVRILAAAFGVEFTAALKAADVALKAVGITLGIVTGAFVAFAAAMAAVQFYEFITGFKRMQAAAENAGLQISNIQKILDMDLKDTKRRGAEKIAEMKKNFATEESIRGQELKNLFEYRNKVALALFDAKAAQDRANAAAAKKRGIFGVNEETAKQEAENVKAAGEQVLKLEQELYDLDSELNVKNNNKKEQDTKEYLQNRIKAIDASIENEIHSEQTRSTTLIALLEERNTIVDKLDKDHHLTLEERLERSRQQRQKINNAIIDDEVRVAERRIKILEDEIIGAGQGTQKQFDLRREIIAENLKKELAEARRDERTRDENQRAARTKHYLALREIEKNELEARKTLTQTYRNSETENTVKFFNLERELLMDEMAIQLKIYENNEKMKLALKEEYAKKLRDVDAKQLEYQGDLMQRAADVEWQGMGKQEKVGLNWLISKNNKVREINEEQYQYQIAAETLNYEAAKKRAAGNAAELQIIEAEHIRNINQLRANQIETNQQLNQMMAMTAIQFGQTISQIGDVLLNNAQGRNKKQFESAKKIMKASIVIEKAGAIGQIWSNNAIANAKATAVFWKTFGQPWVTINTIQAGLATAATIASAAKAIQEIDGKQFTPEPSSMGKNYQYGGMVQGKRHAEGGTMIEAEQGEAVMTRGAVTMFAPLLSTLNQMGGGTAFNRGAVGQAGFDAPDYKTANNMQSQQIVKTYVVENELTSSQQKQARLKNLSTL